MWSIHDFPTYDLFSSCVGCLLCGPMIEFKSSKKLKWCVVGFRGICQGAIHINELNQPLMGKQRIVLHPYNFMH
jgi:hypothetical protein